MPKKYQLPDFLQGRVPEVVYDRWLERKARAHVRRDRKRNNDTATRQAYKEAIHRAVLLSGGRDWYTGEDLAWELISSYNNEESRIGRRKYKAAFALLPTVDHVGDGLGPADFRICAWRTNDAKNDLDYREFVELCKRVVEFSNRQVANL
jgi:hypothetical protein